MKLNDDQQLKLDLGKSMGQKYAEKIYAHYKAYIGKTFFLTMLILLFIGVWKWAFIMFLVWHFNQIILDNWYFIAETRNGGDKKS